MKLKFLYALGLFLCLSTLASSNECIRHCPKMAKPSVHPVKDGQAEATLSATIEEEESRHAFSPIIRLLYI
jgi:hypothetical protein